MQKGNSSNYNTNYYSNSYSNKGGNGSNYSSNQDYNSNYNANSKNNTAFYQNKPNSTNYRENTKNYAKNYNSKKAKEKEIITYLEEELVEDYELIDDPVELKKFCVNDPEQNIKVVESACPVNSDLMMIDISMNPKGVDEEVVYLRHPEYIKNIRRGNTIVEFYKYDKRSDKYNFSYSVMARRGMMKFVDLPYEVVEIKDEHYMRVEHITEESRLNARKYIMGPVFRAFDKGNSVEVFKLIKANGENAQVSYSKDAGMWVIGSKNVSLLAATREDLEYYERKDGQINRYSFAYVIGHCWFDYLDKLSLKSKGKEVKDLQDYLSDKTLIGEYVGNQNHQHLIRYVKHTILFYAVVENYSDLTALTVKESYSVFKKFKLDVVPYEQIGVFSDHKSLCQALDKLYVRIAESSIIDEEEGSVLYFSEIEKNQKNNKTYERILVLCKLKTFEYRVYRKLREKLKNHLLESEERNSFSSRRKINQFFDEVRVMLQGYNLPMPLSFYYKVAETAFAFVNKFYENCRDLHSSYIDFIEVIHSIVDQTVDLKSRMIKGNNIMTYDTLLKNVIKSKKVVELYIYSPPLYLSENLLKSVETKFKTEIRSAILNEYTGVNSEVVVYHINMHNFRVINKLEENKFIFIVGVSNESINKSLGNISEKIQIPQFISYNKNPTLTPFLEFDEDKRKDVMKEYVENSKLFVEGLKKYIPDKIRVYEEIKSEESFMSDLESVIEGIKGKIKNLSEEKIKGEQFLYNDEGVVLVGERNSSTGNTKNNLTSSLKRSSNRIDLYETHKNIFLPLREEFLKDCHISKEDVKISILPSNNSKKKTIIILVPMTIPGTGKTYFVEQLEEILNSQMKSQIAFDSVSSDSIRRSIIDSIMYNKGFDFDYAFNLSGKKATQIFESELRKKFRKLVENNTLSLLYIDKNHPPNAITRAMEPLRSEMETMQDMDQVDVRFVALLPDCEYPINLGTNKSIPFSMSYFIQCYLRIKHRKNHPTLNGDNRNLICILGMFINNFVNLPLTEQSLIMHYQFSKAIKLPFTFEFPEEKLPQDLKEACVEFLGNIPKGNAMPEYDNRARNLEKLINKYYSKPDVFKSTKSLVKDTAGPVIWKLFGLEGGKDEEISKEKVIMDVKEEIIIQPVKKLKDLLNNNNNKKIVPEKKTQQNPNPNPKSKPRDFAYLGLVISDSLPTIYKQVLIHSLSQILSFNPEETEASDLVKSLCKNSLLKNWRCPHPEGDKWHVTTLYKGSSTENKYFEHQAYKEFEEGKVVNINIHGLVYMPYRTIFCIVSTPAYVDNKFPHMTTLVNQFQPKESNDVMIGLFGPGGMKEKEFGKMFSDGEERVEKIELKMGGFFRDCYIYKFEKPVVVESKMTAFYHQK